MAEPDPWADLAADIRRGRASAIEQAEAWQARAEKAEARVAELEAQVEALAASLEWALGQAAGRGGLAHPTSFYALSEAAARTALAKARARSPAEEPDHA